MNTKIQFTHLTTSRFESTSRLFQDKKNIHYPTNFSSSPSPGNHPKEETLSEYSPSSSHFTNNTEEDTSKNHLPYLSFSPSTYKGDPYPHLKDDST